MNEAVSVTRWLTDHQARPLPSARDPSLAPCGLRPGFAVMATSQAQGRGSVHDRPVGRLSRIAPPSWPKVTRRPGPAWPSCGQGLHSLARMASDEMYREMLLAPLRKCATYTPKFGGGQGGAG